MDAIRTLKEARWAQWAGRHPMAWLASMVITLAVAWGLALTVFDGTIFEVIVPITSVVLLIAWPVGLSVGRDKYREEKSKQNKGR